MYVYPFSPNTTPIRLPCNSEQSSMCYTIGPCWLSILNAVCIGPFLTLRHLQEFTLAKVSICSRRLPGHQRLMVSLFSHFNKRKLHLALAVFQVLIFQNNQYTNVAYFGVAHSILQLKLKESRIGREKTLDQKSDSIHYNSHWNQTRVQLS